MQAIFLSSICSLQGTVTAEWDNLTLPRLIEGNEIWRLLSTWFICCVLFISPVTPYNIVRIFPSPNYLPTVITTFCLQPSLQRSHSIQRVDIAIPRKYHMKPPVPASNKCITSVSQYLLIFSHSDSYLKREFATIMEADVGRLSTYSTFAVFYCHTA